MNRPRRDPDDYEGHQMRKHHAYDGPRVRTVWVPKPQPKPEPLAKRP